MEFKKLILVDLPGSESNDLIQGSEAVLDADMTVVSFWPATIDRSLLETCEQARTIPGCVIGRVESFYYFSLSARLPKDGNEARTCSRVGNTCT